MDKFSFNDQSAQEEIVSLNNVGGESCGRWIDLNQTKTNVVVGGVGAGSDDVSVRKSTEETVRSEIEKTTNSTSGVSCSVNKETKSISEEIQALRRVDLESSVNILETSRECVVPFQVSKNSSSIRNQGNFDDSRAHGNSAKNRDAMSI